MEAVYEKFLELGKKSEVLLQSQYMDEEEREEFLKNLKRAGRDVGGILRDGRCFSEGIDLTQDRLIGAMIVGTGIPQVCNEREILKQYLEQRDLTMPISIPE